MVVNVDREPVLINQTLVEILCSRMNAEIKAIKDAYTKGLKQNRMEYNTMRQLLY